MENVEQVPQGTQRIFISPIVLEYLRDRFLNDVHELLDDPSYIVPDEPDDWSIEKWMAMYVLTADFLGIDFWDLAEKIGTAEEHTRLMSLIAEVGIEPGWRPKES